jgi:hypothetical protein
MEAAAWKEKSSTCGSKKQKKAGASAGFPVCKESRVS